MRAAIALAILIGTTWTALAGSNGPYIVISGRPGVPIIINGVDASYTVVEGDWGLGKGIHVEPTVYGPVPSSTRLSVTIIRVPVASRAMGALKSNPPASRGPPRTSISHGRWNPCRNRRSLKCHFIRLR